MPDSSQPTSPTGDDGLSRRTARDQVLVAGAGGDAGEPPAEGDAAGDDSGAPAHSSTRTIIEWVVVIAGAVLIAVLVRTFVFQTFWIPSPSMATTLVKDDRVLVNKLSYRLHDPRRGDVVVFERPPNEVGGPGDIKDLIKRVIALPGERISIMDNQVRIDGKVLDEPYTHDLPTEAKVGCGPGDTTGIDTPQGFLVPEGHVFVMGDNRTNSLDGRCFGPIDEDLIVGRAFVIIWPPSKVGGL